ncbi:MAG: UDP-2,4-diacetamido-2,4,6-trideoxy-beta-L-altropyranose hydrolase [Fuerstiella sp.]|nr:UDP-2,4-diacetamido-2,4,6-trideoxy-beta-L-altropyranose hydrolase [Fuerstiella sp.]
MSQKPGTLVVRTDAGIEIGTGHVMRCLALCQAWQDLGGNVIVVSSNLPQHLSDRLDQEGFQLEQIEVSPGSNADADQTATLASLMKTTTVVVDGYHFSDSFRQRLRNCGCRVIAIDDWGEATAADVVLNQNLNASVDDYPNLAADSAILAGCQFALLRREFREQRQQCNRIRTSPDRVLVSCGGSDPQNATTKILKSLDCPALEVLEVVVVAGGCNRRANQLRELSKSLRADVRIEHNCRDMASLMNWADIAIVAAGSTCWELACVGVPMIAAITTDNQVRLAQSVAENGLGWNVGWIQQLSPARIPEIFTQIRSDSKQLSRVSHAGRNIVDGRGAMRVARRLADPALNLRPACFKDSRLLWQWRNEKTVRQTSFSTDPVPWKDHNQWFESRLQQSECQILIAENEKGQPIGQVRLDLEDHRATISVSIAAEFRAFGFGTALIRAATNRAFVNHRVEFVDAFIRDDNKASQAAFIKAEYDRQMSKSGEEASRLHFVARNPQPQCRAA